MEGVFNKPVEAVTKENPSNNVTAFICTIEGWKTKIKNLHWSANKMNTHKLLDEIADFVSEYQDSLAEDYMGVHGKFNPDFLKGTPCACNDMRDLLKVMKTYTSTFYSKLPSGQMYTGIKSETETFIHNINKYTYLANLCD